MLKRGWLCIVVVGGWLVAALWGSPALGQSNNPTGESPHQKVQSLESPFKQPDDETAFWLSKKGASEKYRVICEEPKNREYADLCQQWRMAESVIQQIDWARRQFWLSAVGMIGLLATIIYTHLTLRLTANTTQRQLRAYLSMTPNELGGFFEDGLVRIVFEVKNHGPTPARDINHVFGMGIFPCPLPEIFEFPEPNRQVDAEFAVYSGTPERTWFNSGIPIARDEVASTRKNETRLHCWGKTFYRDCFDNKCSVKFHFSVGGENFVAAQDLYRRGHRGENIPKWQWEYGHGHGEYE